MAVRCGWVWWSCFVYFCQLYLWTQRSQMRLIFVWTILWHWGQVNLDCRFSLSCLSFRHFFSSSSADRFDSKIVVPSLIIIHLLIQLLISSFDLFSSDSLPWDESKRFALVTGCHPFKTDAHSIKETKLPTAPISGSMLYSRFFTTEM